MSALVSGVGGVANGGGAGPVRRGLTEEAVLESAAQWFSRMGYHGASLADIASQLGVTKPALYRYARSKSELLFKLHMRSLESAKQARDAAMRDGRDGADRLARLVRNFVLSMTGSITNTFLLLEPGMLEQEQYEIIIAARRWLEHDMRSIVRQGIADGSIVACDPKLVVFIVVGAQNWIRNWYRPGGAWSGEQIAQGVSVMLRRMVASTPGTDLPTDLSRWTPEAPAA